jgi:hypothetical protein
MHTLQVDLAERSYPILIGAGLLQSRELLDTHIRGRDAVLISNTVVAPLYADRVKSALHDRRIIEVILPDGEQHKTLNTAGRVFDVLIASVATQCCWRWEEASSETWWDLWQPATSAASPSYRFRPLYWLTWTPRWVVRLPSIILAAKI